MRARMLKRASALGPDTTSTRTSGRFAIDLARFFDMIEDQRSAQLRKDADIYSMPDLPKPLRAFLSRPCRGIGGIEPAQH